MKSFVLFFVPRATSFGGSDAAAPTVSARPNGALRATRSAAMVLLLVCGVVLSPPRNAAGVPIELTADQRAAVLAEAQAAFDRGMALRESDYPAARLAFEEAAAKFQLVVDGMDTSEGTSGGGDPALRGLRDGRGLGPLYFNLANAYLLAHEPGRAIANYQRAAALLPGDAQVAANLARARAMVEAPGVTITSGLVDRAIGWLPQRATMWLGLVAWNAFWVGLAGMMLHRARFWRYMLVPAGAVALLALGTVGYVWAQQPTMSHGVIVAQNVVVRDGDGENFAPAMDHPLEEGAEFTLLGGRDRWLHIALTDGRTGWVTADDAEVVKMAPRL